MLQPFSRTQGFACTGKALPAKEAAAREKLIPVLDWYFEARDRAGLDSFPAELFWPCTEQGSPREPGLPEGVYAAPEEPAAADGPGKAEGRAGDRADEKGHGRAKKRRGPMHWRYVLDEARFAETARLLGRTADAETGAGSAAAQGFSEDDLLFLLLIDEAIDCSATSETDTGLAYLVTIREDALDFFGDAWRLLARFSAISLELERDGRVLLANQPLITKLTRDSAEGRQTLVLDINPLFLAALAPESALLADWAALARRRGARPLPGCLTLMALFFSCLCSWDAQDGAWGSEAPELAEQEIARMLGVDTACGEGTDTLSARLAECCAEISTLPNWKVRSFREIATDGCFDEGEAIVRIEYSGCEDWD